MLILGLTGGIAMGKSRCAGIFRAFGVPVLDSDAVVHGLYAPQGRAVAPVLAAFPGCGSAEEGLNREALRRLVLADAGRLRQLEGIVHALVRDEQRAFLTRCSRDGRPLVVLDVPLLFETGGDRQVDLVLTVSTSGQLQRDRALRRPGMTEARLAAIRRQQWRDGERRRRADVILPGGHDRGAIAARIGTLIGELQGRRGIAWPQRWLSRRNLPPPEAHR